VSVRSDAQGCCPNRRHRASSRSRLAAAVVSSFALLSSGVAAQGSGDPKEIGEIVFECSSINFAWGHRHRGYYVRRDGTLLRYDRSGDPWVPESAIGEDGRVAEADLRAKFSTAETYRQIPAARVAAKARLLPRAAEGRPTKKHTAYDAGTSGCVGYLFDAATRQYETIQLGSEGDFRIENPKSEAKGLREWLRELAPPRSAPDTTTSPKR
jgi:hypothetical protein